MFYGQRTNWSWFGGKHFKRSQCTLMPKGAANLRDGSKKLMPGFDSGSSNGRQALRSKDCRLLTVQSPSGLVARSRQKDSLLAFHAKLVRREGLPHCQYDDVETAKDHWILHIFILTMSHSEMSSKLVSSRRKRHRTSTTAARGLPTLV